MLMVLLLGGGEASRSADGRASPSTGCSHRRFLWETGIVIGNRRIAYWLAVVEEGSFTRAALRMHVSQPSLSQQVRLLEQEVGGELLERLPRSVRLTAAGKAFLPHAQVAVRAVERAQQAVRSALELETGELEISTVRSIAAGILPDLVKSWRQRHPGTFVRLHEFTHRSLAEDSVRGGVGDLGIGPPPIGWTRPVRRVGWEEFLGVLSPHHVVLRSQVESAARLAAAGVGPTLVPENVIPDGLNGARMRIDPPLGRELTVYAREQWGPLGGAFVDLMAETRWAKPPRGALVVPWPGV